MLVRLISSLPAHQLLPGKDDIHCSQYQFKDYSGKLDRHKIHEGQLADVIIRPLYFCKVIAI